MTHEAIIECWYCEEEITITWTRHNEDFHDLGYVDLTSLAAHLKTCPYRPTHTP